MMGSRDTGWERKRQPPLQAHGCIPSTKGPVRACMSARDRNRETQPAAPPLPPLSIPGHVFHGPGQIRWFLGRTPAPGTETALAWPSPAPGSSPSALLHHAAPVRQRRHPAPCHWSFGSGGGGKWLGSGRFRARSRGGRGYFWGSAAGRDGGDRPGRGNNFSRQRVHGNRDGEGTETPFVGEAGEKLERKRSLWGGRFVFEGGQR